LAHLLLLTCGTFTPVLVLRVRSPYVHNRQTDRQTDGQHPQCGLLGWPHNDVANYFAVTSIGGQLLPWREVHVKIRAGRPSGGAKMIIAKEGSDLHIVCEASANGTNACGLQSRHQPRIPTAFTNPEFRDWRRGNSITQDFRIVVKVLYSFSILTR